MSKDTGENRRVDSKTDEDLKRIWKHCGGMHDEK